MEPKDYISAIAEKITEVALEESRFWNEDSWQKAMMRRSKADLSLDLPEELRASYRASKEDAAFQEHMKKKDKNPEQFQYPDLPQSVKTWPTHKFDDNKRTPEQEKADWERATAKYKEILNTPTSELLAQAGASPELVAAKRAENADVEYQKSIKDSRKTRK